MMQRDTSSEMKPVVYQEWYVVDKKEVTITSTMCSSNPWNPHYWYAPLTGMHQVGVTLFATLQEAKDHLMDTLAEEQKDISDRLWKYMSTYIN